MSERDIKIIADSTEIGATLNDTNTATQIWEAVPIEASASTWGDEIYFGILVEAEEKNGREILEAWWPWLLAAGEGVLHVFQEDAGQPWRRNSSCKCRERYWLHARRRDGAQTSNLW